MNDVVRDLGQRAELRETHISWVLLSERTVLKVKKPVNFGFLDFSTLELRRRACETEVELNTRLAPGVYLAVVPIYRSASGSHRAAHAQGAPLPASGARAARSAEQEPREGEQLVEWGVLMRRLPDTDRADVRLAEGRLAWPDLATFAGALARFHAGAATGDAISRHGRVEAIAENVRENFAQAHASLSEFVSEAEQAEVEGWQLRFLEQRAELFERRRRAGKIRDGHGDLRLEHLYIDGSGHPLVIDCIEFNERFRMGDVCSDVAFLSMDLAWHGQVALKERFLARYARESQDYDLYSVVDFYESYRAYVRAKVSVLALETSSLEPEAQRRLREAARRYFLLALAAERPPLQAPRLIAVGGMIASGKSTLADALGERLAAPVISSDRTRKFLLGVPPSRPLRTGAFQAAYSAEQTERVHAEVLRRARVVLASGRTVILDATFRSAAQRRAARELAAQARVPFTLVECQTPEAVARERLLRRAEGASVSDGRLEILDEFMRSYEPVRELPSPEHIALDTSGQLEASLAALERAGLSPIA